MTCNVQLQGNTRRTEELQMPGSEWLRDTPEGMQRRLMQHL